jgi:hypothetical protein
MQTKNSKSRKAPVTDAQTKKAVPVKASEQKTRVTRSSKPSLAGAVAKGRSIKSADDKKAQVVASEKTKKERKDKLVRDSFKFPSAEYLAFDELKARCLKQGYAVKKNELVRLGLQVLKALSDEDLLTKVQQVEKLKTGRPAK